MQFGCVAAPDITPFQRPIPNRNLEWAFYLDMINETNAKKFCSEDITLIENYWDAVNDETQVWECHHKNEIFRGISVSRALLKDIGLYYGCPASELIFLTKSEHIRLHKKGKPISEAQKKYQAKKRGN